MRYCGSDLARLRTGQIIQAQVRNAFQTLETAIQRRQRGEAELFAYVLEECGWKEVPSLAKFQILPTTLPDRKNTRAKYWRTVAEELQKTITKLRESPRPDRPTFPRAPR